MTAKEHVRILSLRKMGLGDAAFSGGGEFRWDFSLPIPVALKRFGSPKKCKAFLSLKKRAVAILFVDSEFFVAVRALPFLYQWRVLVIVKK